MSQSIQVDLRITSPPTPLSRIRTMESATNNKTVPSKEESVSRYFTSVLFFIATFKMNECEAGLLMFKMCFFRGRLPLTG